MGRMLPFRFVTGKVGKEVMGQRLVALFFRSATVLQADESYKEKRGDIMPAHKSSFIY